MGPVLDSDVVLVAILTVLGASLGLLHVALGVRAFRRSPWAGLASLVLPFGTVVVAWRSGAPRAAWLYALGAALYVVLLTAASC